MKILLIILAVALIIAIVYIVKFIKRNGLLNELKIQLKSDIKRLKGDADWLLKERNKAREEATVEANLAKERGETIKKFEGILNTAHNTLVNDLIFVIEDGSTDIAFNVKVKTIADDDGTTTLQPSIRRKVDGVWKVVPVFLNYRNPKDYFIAPIS